MAGQKYVFPGTYAVRSTTLRAVFMDLATELGEQGFQWIFIVHGHGAPNHNRSLDEASDYFRDSFGGHMVHLLGLMPVFTAGGEPSDDVRKEDGFSVHAGAEETARLLAIRPALVNPGYGGAAPYTGRDWKELVQIARAPGWPGYFGSPRLARAADGSGANQSLARAATAYALKILDGLDERTIPRYGSIMRDSPYNVSIDRDALERDKQVERRQHAWLERRGLR